MIKSILLLCSLLLAPLQADAAQYVQHDHRHHVAQRQELDTYPAIQFAQLGTLPFSGAIPTSGGTCTTNGSDGFAAAPAGTAQFPTLFSGYAASPSWCVAGVHYAVGPIPNATVSGNTVTETNVVNIPVSQDQKTFYPQNGGSLPSGITAGTPVTICGVSGSAGTYTYTLSVSSTCASTITLGSLSTSFIALKVPEKTTNLPANTSGWTGSACGSSSSLFDICFTGNGPTLDHFDFSLNGGWSFNSGTITGFTVTSNYWFIGTNFNGVWLGNDAATNGVFNYNKVDGNAVATYVNANGNTLSGATVNVNSTNGIFQGQTVCDVQSGHTGAITCPGVTVSSINPGVSVTLSSSISSEVFSGDSLGFVLAPWTGTSLYQQPQISESTLGTFSAQYNWIRNTYSTHIQSSIPGTGGAANTSNNFKYNLFENTGWGAQISGAHGDVIQMYCGTVGGTGASCSFQGIVIDYNTAIQNNIKAEAGTTTFSTLYSGTFGGTAVSVDISHNVGIYSVAGGNNTSTFGLGTINSSWVSSSINMSNNYVDPTSASNGGASFGAAFWANVAPGNGGGTGPFTPTCTSTNNVNLVTGASLGPAPGSFC